MTAEEFTSKQEKLALSNVALAELLGTSESAISLWARGKRPIPDTVANLFNFHVAEKLKTTELPLTLTELFALSRLAEKRGQTVENLLLSLIKSSGNAGTPPQTAPAVGGKTLLPLKVK